MMSQWIRFAPAAFAAAISSAHLEKSQESSEGETQIPLRTSLISLRVFIFKIILEDPLKKKALNVIMFRNRQ